MGAITLSGRVPPSGRKNRYQRGWVEVGQHGHLVARRYVETNHYYQFTLRPGTYDVAGYTQWGRCRDSVELGDLPM